MKKLFDLSALAVFFMILLIPAAAAELIHGEVTAVNRENNSVTLSPLHSSAENLPAAVDVRLDDNAFKQSPGLGSIDQLTVGDEIIVEARKPFLGGWKAQAILSTTQIKGLNPAIATQQVEITPPAQSIIAGEQGAQQQAAEFVEGARDYQM